MSPGPETKEFKKRRREVATVIFVGALFILLTWGEFHLTQISQKLPFVHSIFFFGLVNFNIILLLFLLFLIFRNVVKIFVEREGKLVGGSLKGKLVASFVTFSVVPTALMFLISVFYINSSFDKWFSIKMASVLKDSLEVTNAYYQGAKKKNYHFAHQIAQQVRQEEGPSRWSRLIQQTQVIYSLDAVEFYPEIFGERIISVSKEESIPEVPKAAMEFLQKGIIQKSDSSTIHHFGEGNLIRVIVPTEYKRGGETRTGAIVVSSYIPLSLTAKMDDIATTYQDFRDVNPLEYPLKSIYLVILILMTLVILFGGVWFGFHLARQLSTPLELLAQATRRVSEGKYQPLHLKSGSAEINQLVSSFNQMTSDLGDYQKELIESNVSLDKHNRYIEVILSNVSAGVISVDSNGVVTTINRHACKLLKIRPEKFIGREMRSLLPPEELKIFDELIANMKQYRALSIQKELRLNVGGESQLMQVTLSILRDESGADLGMVGVFDDLTMLINAQRAAAWREVARRIAHEIKNPLTPIKLSAQRLEKKFGMQISDPAFSACTTTIIDQVDTLRDLVNEFSHFARLPQSKPVRSSLNQVVESSMVLYETGHKDIQFSTDLDSRLPDFDFDPEQMKRLLSNLLENAVAAVEGLERSPKIEVSTQYEEVLGIVRISVKDNGVGIALENRHRIFEPYFSTKKHGTGLGLAIVKRIIDDHNGFIRSYANEPFGAKFVVELPMVSGRSSAEKI